MDKSPSAVLRAARADPRPFGLFGAWSQGRALVGSDPLVVLEDPEDPFSVLDQQPKIEYQEGEFATNGATGGGWVGYLGYGLGAMVERLPSPPPRPVPVPRSILAFYDHLVSCDSAGNWFFEALWSDEQSERLESRLCEWRRRALEPVPPQGEYRLGTFMLNPGPERHLVSISRAIEHIRSGEVFQVNVCTRLEAPFFGDPVELFCKGADLLDPRYGAFLSHPSVALASFSPELFLKCRNSRVLSSPIKGTAPRGASSPNELLGSGKDRAENVMIVDLMRNDLGRVCRYGSVAVPELFRLEEHPGVWHLVSDVTGELPEAVSNAELLRATFPPGSVTGAPKVRAMELVTELEATAREIYTGSIGIASPLTGLELNVAIRTFELSGTKAWLGVGGGIVADSDPNNELQECFDKAAPLLSAVGATPRFMALSQRTDRAGLAPAPVASHGEPALGVFETMLVLEGRIVELESHLGRLAASVICLYGSQLPASFGAEIVKAALDRPGSQRLRVLVRPSKQEGLAWEISAVPAPEAFSKTIGTSVTLVPAVVEGGFGRHKFHDRRLFAGLRQTLELGAGTQLLLVDEDKNVLETEQANVFAAFGDLIRTPDLDGRILSGTTREKVIRLALAEGLNVSEEPMSLDELAASDEAFITSSIRGLCAVGQVLSIGRLKTGPVGSLLARALWKAWNEGSPSAS